MHIIIFIICIKSSTTMGASTGTLERLTLSTLKTKTNVPHDQVKYDTHLLFDLSTRLINVLCRVMQKSGSNSCRSCNSSSSILGVVIWTDTDLRLDVLLWPSVVLKDCKRIKNRRLHLPSEYIFRLKLWKIKSFNFKFKCSIVLIESRIGGG